MKPKNLFEATCAAELKGRLAKLGKESRPQWGKMNAAQAVAHCAAGFAMASGELKPPRALLGRLIGGFVKRIVVKDDKPFARNAPTAKELLVSADLDMNAERARLAACIDQFTELGAKGCTEYPHPFFGRLTPQEWAILMYKHTDHHLRQFGV